MTSLNDPDTVASKAIALPGTKLISVPALTEGALETVAVLVAVASEHPPVPVTV